jgi:hypothetical protein
MARRVKLRKRNPATVAPTRAMAVSGRLSRGRRGCRALYKIPRVKEIK